MKATVNGVELDYEELGKGPAVLLVHGFPLDRTIWLPQARALSDRFRFILPDLRGFGQSSPTDGTLGMDLLAEDLRALLDHLNIPQATIGGLSMGGYVALAFMRRHSARARALVLADTKAAADTEEARKAREEFAQAVKSGGAGVAAERMLPKMYTPGTLDGNPSLVDRTRRMMEGASITGIVGALRGMAERSDSTPLLPSIRVPTLVLVGDQDALTPPEDSRAMAARLPNATTAVIPGAGHLSTLERPGDVTEALARFLDSV